MRTPEEIISDYRSAYFAANLKDSDKVRYDRGWFRWTNSAGKDFLAKRRSEIEQMTATLRYRATL